METDRTLTALESHCFEMLTEFLKIRKPELKEAYFICDGIVAKIVDSNDKQNYEIIIKVSP